MKMRCPSNQRVSFHLHSLARHTRLNDHRCSAASHVPFYLQRPIFTQNHNAIPTVATEADSQQKLVSASADQSMSVDSHHDIKSTLKHSYKIPSPTMVLPSDRATSLHTDSTMNLSKIQRSM